MIDSKKLFRIIENISAVVGFVTLPISMVLLFGKSDAWTIVLAVAVFLVSIAAIGAIVTAIARRKNKAERFSGANSSQVAKNIANSLARTYNQGASDPNKYDTVILFGDSLLRPLYLGGCYDCYVRIALLIIKASQAKNNYLVQAKTYAGLGWMDIIFGNYDQAKQHIDEAIKIAQQQQNSENTDETHRQKYLMVEAKARRHLLALYGYPDKREYHLKEYAKERKDLYELANKLPDGIEKEIFLGGVVYGEAEYAFCREQYKKARELCQKADRMRSNLNDNSRAVRFYAQMGKIELFDENPEKALGFFDNGYSASVGEDRIDEIVKNAYGKACCWLLKNNAREAEKCLEDIRDYNGLRLAPNDYLIVKKYNSIKKTKGVD